MRITTVYCLVVHSVAQWWRQLSCGFFSRGIRRVIAVRVFVQILHLEKNLMSVSKTESSS